MIPLFVGYAMIVWVLAARYRRQLAGFAAVAAGLLGLLGLNHLHTKLGDWSEGEIYLPVLRSIMYPYTGLVAMVGVFIACIPRVSSTGCRRCGYSLYGLEELGGVLICPECGGRHPIPAVYRRSGADRDDYRGTDRVAPPGRSAADQPPEAPDKQDGQRQPADQPPPQAREHAR